MASDRRAPGISAFSRNAISSAQYASHGSQLRSTHADSLRTQLSVFQTLLQQFSSTHAKEIRSNPSFRAEFARMCNAIGVDPLVSSNTKRPQSSGASSLWAQMLGGSVNDFYFELAVRIVEICRATRSENGGLIAVSEMTKRVQRGRAASSGMEVSNDDILQAVQSLKPLGSGFAVVNLGSKQMIRSVPKELNTDQSQILAAIQVEGYVTVSILVDNFEWSSVRAVAVLDDLLADSLVWIDKEANETAYWTPAFIQETGSIR